MPRIVVIAGEASGDQLGAGLIAAAKDLDPTIEFVGVGGPAMEAAGCDRHALARVRAPIGVAISSHTPEEIAVSVTAEIIGIKNGAIK